MLRVELEVEEVVTGFGLKLPLVFRGSPLRLRVTELEELTAVTPTVTLALLPRLIVTEAGAERLKPGAGAVTVRLRLVECVSIPLVPVIVMG